MDPAELKRRLAVTEQIAHEAGTLARTWFDKRDRLRIETKGPQNLVSEADRAVEVLIRKRLAAAFPGERVIGEEGGDDDAEGHNGAEGSSAPIWIVDPIDGTQCFLSGIPSWCVSIGMVGETGMGLGVIHDPVVGETFTGGPALGAFCNGRPMRVHEAAGFGDGMVEVGVSLRRPVDETLAVLERLLRAGGIYHRSGSGALSLAYVAAGRYIGYYEDHMNTWDSCAGVALVEGAGGWCSDILAGDGLTRGARVLASGQNLAPAMRALAEGLGETQ
ncbi:MAG: inositol monophosphatase family protein [Alphaproteobacteria bacterium]